MAELGCDRRGNGVADESLNVHDVVMPNLMALSSATDLRATVHASLETIRNLLMAKQSNDEELRVLTQQVELLLTEQAERLQTTNRNLEAFNYSAAHDLFAPLRRITGYTCLLQEQCVGKLDQEEMDYLNRISKSTQHMNDLITALLQLSQSTYQNLKRDLVNLSEVVADTANELSQSTSDRRVDFVIQPGIRVFGDSNLLEIAMKNLLTNAWKFTCRRDPAQIEFGACEQTADHTCYVRDNGVGFDMSNLEQMFHAFQRLHSSKDFPGNGIGLTTVQRIINRHGGEIWAEGEVNKGATFYFTLQSWAL